MNLFGNGHLAKRNVRGKGKGVRPPKPPTESEVTKLRIVAGTHRGRIIPFATDPKTRPMKDRTREALFSRVGGKLDGYVALDFFAGTGILALESLSRAAAFAIAVELDRQAVRNIREASIQLGLDERLRVLHEDTFHWMATPSQFWETIPESLRQQPWCVFICPPYRLWESEKKNMAKLVEFCCEHAPPDSLICLEFEIETPTELFLPEGWDWEPRRYPPASLVIGDRLASKHTDAPAKESPMEDVDLP